MVEWGRAPADGNPRRRPERSAGSGGGKEVAILELWIQAEGAVLLWIQENLRFDLLTPLVRFITFLGNGGWFWIVLALLLCGFRRTRRAGLAAGAALLLSLLVNNLLLKNLVARVRPYEVIQGLRILIPPPQDFSFPSGHAGASFAAAAAMYPYLRHPYGRGLLILAGLIALSRLYLGVHYPTDVLAGALIGTLLGVAAARLIGRLRGRFLDRLPD